MSAFTFVSSALNDETVPLTNGNSHEAIKEDMKIINTSLNFINDLLRNMLDVNRSDQLRIDIAPVNLWSGVFRPVETMLHRRDTGVEILIDCPPDIVVKTDPLRLEQVIMNLGKNSLKFVDKGFIRFRMELVDGHVRISVEDSGPGIPQSKRQHLFSKFQERLDYLCQGTGIGLCLCKNLVELMGGNLWLDERYDSGIEGSPGARFVVDLNTPPEPVEVIAPIDAVASSEALENASNIALAPEDKGTPSESLPSDLSILCVDDDLVLRKLFSRSVKKATTNWTITEAVNGETALRLAEEQVFDMIFLDQYMVSNTEKQLLGTETASALRSRGVQSTICGLSANDLEDSFLSSGADAFMMKPFPSNTEAMMKELVRVITSGNNRGGA